MSASGPSGPLVQNILFKKKISGTLSDSRTVWIQIRIHLVGIWPFNPAPRSPVWSWGKIVQRILVYLLSSLIWYVIWPCSENLIFDPPSSPKSHPLSMTQVTEWKSYLIFIISFICEKTHKVWFKNLWNWLCNWSLMIFDLLAPNQGLRWWGPKHCVTACAIHVSNSHTKFGWISEKKIFLTPQPPCISQVQPLGHAPGDGMKILSNMFYIFHLWEDTQSLV